jgi:hypothetical protein
METILKEYKELTALNNHNEAALVILKEFGSQGEIDAMTAIKERTDKRGFILLNDQLERQAIMTKYNKIIALMQSNDRKLTVLYKLIDSLPELDNEDEPLEGSEAVSILAQLWEEIKEAAKP